VSTLSRVQGVCCRWWRPTVVCGRRRAGGLSKTGAIVNVASSLTLARTVRMSDELPPQYTKAERAEFRSRAGYWQQRTVILADQLGQAQMQQRRYGRLAQESR